MRTTSSLRSLKSQLAFSSVPLQVHRGGVGPLTPFQYTLTYYFCWYHYPPSDDHFISWMREQSLFSFTSWGSRKVGIKITFFWIWQVFVLLVTPKFNLVRGEQGEPEYSKPCIYSTKCVSYVCFQVFLMSEVMTEQENFLSPLNIQTPPSSPLHPIVPREVSV